MMIRFARVSLDGGEPDWIDVPHKHYDGIGGLWELHRRYEPVAGAAGEATAPAGRAQVNRARAAGCRAWKYRSALTQRLRAP